MLRQEDCLGYVVKPCLKKPNQNKRRYFEDKRAGA
jgi:hypothetical protein